MKQFINKYNQIADKYIQKYFPGAESIENQKKGSACDYILPNGELIEVKVDKYASISGNLFIEYEYTNKENTNPSGVALTAERGYSLVVIIPEENEKVFKMPAKDLIKFCKDGNIKSRETKPYANGNREGVSSKGFIVPIKLLPIKWRFNESETF